jgi:hypothetical protein
VSDLGEDLVATMSFLGGVEAGAELLLERPSAAGLDGVAGSDGFDGERRVGGAGPALR